jgi:hypothetical protein
MAAVPITRSNITAPISGISGEILTPVSTGRDAIGATLDEIFFLK